MTQPSLAAGLNSMLLRIGIALTAGWLATHALAEPLGIYISQPNNVKVGDAVEVNLRGDLPAHSIDLYLYVIKADSGAQSFYYEKMIHDPTDPVRPWRANITGPKLPETNPIFTFRVGVPGQFRVGVKAQPAGTRYSQGDAQESNFLVREGGTGSQPGGSVSPPTAISRPRGEEIMKLTLGTDSNGDGLWDDMYSYIEMAFGHPQQKMRAINLAKSFQDVLLLIGAKRERIEPVLKNHYLAHRCFFDSYSDSASGKKPYRELVDAFFLPDDRSASLAIFKMSIGAQIVFPSGMRDSIRCN